MNSEIQTEIVLPPQPPTNQEERNIKNIIRQQVIKNVLYTDGTFVPGKFEYVKDKNFREMLVTAWQAINMTESWHFMAQPIDSFMWSDDPQLNKINKKLQELYNNHSGFTYGYTMREMQSIARYGEVEYKKNNKN
jgi:hypothetical protein